MAEWSELVRLKCIKKVFNTNWSRKVTIASFEGDKENAYQDEINAVVSFNDMTHEKETKGVKEDLHKFLSSDKFSKLIVSDRVREYNRSEYPKFFSGWETFIDNPFLDGELDHLRSKMIERRIWYKSKDDLVEINNYLVKNGMRPLLDIKGEKMINGKRHFMFEAGRVVNN